MRKRVGDRAIPVGWAVGLGYRMTGQLLAIDVTEEVLGPDLGGTPLLTTIISEEIERSVHALLVTPATVADVFTAKGVAGISLAFRQAALFMAIVGGLNQQSLVV